MIFRCFMCKQYKFWNRKKCYTIILTNGEDLDQEISRKKVCQPCGEGIDEVYKQGEQMSKLEPIESEHQDGPSNE